MVDQQCAVCGAVVEPGSFPQLLIDGTLVCQDCVANRPPLKGDRDNEAA